MKNKNICIKKGKKHSGRGYLERYIQSALARNITVFKS